MRRFYEKKRCYAVKGVKRAVKCCAEVLCVSDVKVVYGKCCAEVLCVSDVKVPYYGMRCAVASRCYVIFFSTAR